MISIFVFSQFKQIRHHLKKVWRAFRRMLSPWCTADVHKIEMMLYKNSFSKICFFVKRYQNSLILIFVPSSLLLVCSLSFRFISLSAFIVFLYLLYQVFRFVKCKWLLVISLQLVLFYYFGPGKNLKKCYGEWAMVTGATDGIGFGISFIFIIINRLCWTSCFSWY